MTAYATPDDLLTWFGAKEMAEIAAPDDLGLVTPEMLRLAVKEGEWAELSEVETALLNATLARMREALEGASRRMDSYLGQRWRLPLASPIIHASDLPRVCGDIARFLLMDDRPLEVARDRYDRGIRWLRDLVDGKASLSGADTPANTGMVVPMFFSGDSVFGSRRGW